MQCELSLSCSGGSSVLLRAGPVLSWIRRRRSRTSRRRRSTVQEQEDEHSAGGGAHFITAECTHHSPLILDVFAQNHRFAHTCFSTLFMFASFEVVWRP